MTTDSETPKGTEGTPNPNGSDNAVGQRGSETDADLRKTLADLQRQFDTLSRSVQSDKDRAVKKTNQRLDVLEGDIREVLRTAQREGKNVSDVLSDLEDAEERETRQMLTDMARAFREGRFSSAGERQTPKEDNVASEVVSELGLDEGDTRVQAFRAKSYASREEAYREGAKLFKSILTSQPSDADKASDVSKGAARPSNQEALMQEYREGSKNLYGRDLLRFKQEMRQKGLEIG